MNIDAPLAKTVAAADPVRRARQLRPLIQAASPAIERERGLTQEVRQALYDAGLFKMLLPRSCGGEEVDPLSFVAAIEELAKADASTAWCVAQASGCSLAAAYVEPAVAEEIFGSKDAVLAWGPFGPTVRAMLTDGGFRVTGTWSYASGSRHAQWLGGHSPVVDPDGKPCLGADHKPVERTMLFPKSKAELRDVWHVMGLKGTGSDSYTVTDLFVPAPYSYTRELAAERRETGPLYRFTSYQIYGAAFAAVALGIARATLDAFVQIATSKVPMLGSKPLRDNPVIQSKVAVAEAQWQSSRAFLMQALGDMWDTACRGDSATLQQRAALRLAAVHASHQAKEVVETAYHFAGGTAIFENQAFERRLRDIHAVTQQVQSQFVNFEVAGQVLLGLPVTSKLI
jgi:alkylation response protein AidB-like acyl-CoA dehydrogenase